MNKTPLTKLTGTRVVNDDKNRVFYHGTEVVTFAGKHVTLNNGGHTTKTTKDRMNQAAHEFGYCFKVYQTKKVWFVDVEGQTLKFEGNRAEFYIK